MLMPLVSLQQGNVKKSKKLMKTVNIEDKNLHVFWTKWVVSMKFPVKMWLTIISKVTKNQGFTLSLKSTFLEKPQEGSNWPPAFLGLSIVSILLFQLCTGGYNFFFFFFLLSICMHYTIKNKKTRRSRGTRYIKGAWD